VYGSLYKVIKGTDIMACKKVNPPLLDLKCVGFLFEVIHFGLIITTNHHMECLE